LKSYDRNCMGPVLPPRSTMCGPPAHHYSAPLNFRKGFTFTKSSNVLSISYPTTNPCTVLVDEKAEISAAKSTIADANRAGIPGGGGDGLGLDQSALAPSASGRPKSIAADESSPGGSASGSSSLSAASTAATGKAAGTGGTAGTGTVPDKQTVASLRSVELLHAVADSVDGRGSGGGSGSSSTMVVVKRSRRQAPGDIVTGTDTTASSTDRNGDRADDNDLLHASVGTVELVALPTPVFDQYGELDEPPEPLATTNLLVETAVNSETVYDGRDGDGLSVDGEDISLPPEDDGTFITNDNDLSPVGAPVESSTEQAIIDARPTTEDEKWANDDPSAAVVYAHVPLDQSEVALVSLEDGLELGRERDKHYYKTIEQVAIKAGDDDDGDASKLQEEVRIHTLPPSVVPVQPTAVPVYLINEPNGTSSSREDASNGAQEELPRLLVNISIATDHGSGTVQHSVYVLQVSIPTPPEHMPRPPVESPESPPPPANLAVPPPVQCPPEPPPAPPCPIKCPSDSAFARYRVVAVPVEDDSEFVEIDEDGLEGELVDTGLGEPSSTEPPEALTEANDGLTQEFTTAQRLPELTADEQEEEKHDDDEATTSSSLSSVVASTTSAAQCPEVTPPPILILEGEQSSISKQQRFPMISSSHLPA
uniref:Uncharacterized protein n=1 Tax=Anopheles coluzzii TaxID=1518534 RepID=A0A8W7P0R6_ANOCL